MLSNKLENIYNSLKQVHAIQNRETLSNPAFINCVKDIQETLKTIDYQTSRYQNANIVKKKV